MFFNNLLRRTMNASSDKSWIEQLRPIINVTKSWIVCTSSNSLIALTSSMIWTQSYWQVKASRACSYPGVVS